VDGELGIDRVIGGTFNLLGRNIIAFALLALPLVLAPKVAVVLSGTASATPPRLIAPTGNGGIGVSVLAWLAMVLGLVLLVVPGIIAFCTFAVAVPVLLRERRGVIASLGRSRELTEGHRWKTLGISILLWVVQAIASGLVSDCSALPCSVPAAAETNRVFSEA
jgi:uncharacterized membrane protein